MNNKNYNPLPGSRDTGLEDLQCTQLMGHYGGAMSRTFLVHLQKFLT